MSNSFFISNLAMKILIIVNNSVTKNICSRLYDWKRKNVDTSSLSTHDSPFFILQSYWQKDNELSLSEELQ